MTDKKKILVVEDEQDVSTYLSAFFQDNGYDTVEATDGMAGLELAKSEKPDLITLDMAMPIQSGIRTYRYYKEDPQLKDIPVIIITGMGDAMQGFIKKLGGFTKPEGFMNKPIDKDALIDMVRGLLGG